MQQFLARLLGLDQVSSFEISEMFFAAEWVRGGGFWLFLALVAMVVLAVVYARRLERGSIGARSIIGVLRGLTLILVVLTLANPFIRVTTRQRILPMVTLVFDGTGSMLTRDVVIPASGEDEKVTRLDALRALLRGSFGDSLQGLSDRACRFETLLFDGNSTSRLRHISPASFESSDWLDQLAERLTARGQVSALGAVIDDLAQNHAQANLAAVILFSDFAHNSGPLPTSGPKAELLRGVGVPIQTVGIGQESLADLSITLEVEPRMIVGERTPLVVHVHQEDLPRHHAKITLQARRINGTPNQTAPNQTAPSDAEPDETTNLHVEEIVFQSGTVDRSVPFTPDALGDWEFTATVEPTDGEAVLTNNTAVRRVSAIDDYLRMLYVAFEPDWEWRFVKEALHRDRLVGMQGFRTYLESSDPAVRQGNVLFEETLDTRREELFLHDVILLDDVPQRVLDRRFCELLEEFVGKLGGGLVVVAGPRFGNSALRGTPVEQMLPIKLGTGGIRDAEPFTLERTSHADQFAFMQLDENFDANRRAWETLGELPWYQPVAGVDERAFVLAEHPEDRCADGTTRQPLIAVRRYGRGEVVYLAFNEMWRLRRGTGERFHRRFWSQLIYRLGMSHALGADKRFVVTTDRAEYRVDEMVTLTVEAYDANFIPLAENSLSSGSLRCSLVTPRADERAERKREIAIPWIRPGIFETRFPVSQSGRYVIRVTDPIIETDQVLRVSVQDSSAERRNPVRNKSLQTQISGITGGRSYDINNVKHVLDDLDLSPIVQETVRTRPLWNTPLWCLMIIGIMLSEWLIRRWNHLK